MKEKRDIFSLEDSNLRKKLVVASFFFIFKGKKFGVNSKFLSVNYSALFYIN